MIESVFESFMPDEEIPVQDYLKKKKLIKFFNRETAAAIICVRKLLDKHPLDSETPIYYSTGIVERDDFGLSQIVEACKGSDRKFSQEQFVAKGLSSISPLNQFKVLYNMPLCFISIENNFTGENAVLYSSAAGLITQAKYAPVDSPILLGAGKLYKSGLVEAGFAIADKKDLPQPEAFENKEAIEIFRAWKLGSIQ